MTSGWKLRGVEQNGTPSPDARVLLPGRTKLGLGHSRGLGCLCIGIACYVAIQGVEYRKGGQVARTRRSELR